MLRELKIFKIHAIPTMIEPGAVTGVNNEPVAAVRVVNIKQVWYVVVVVIAGGIARADFFFSRFSPAPLGTFFSW